jgi:asparagine synthase (glutamine-hydrolysing)
VGTKGNRQSLINTGKMGGYLSDGLLFMCGIAGIIFKQDVTPETTSLKTALKQLNHRGPDDQGIESHGQVALGHTRLSIIDLAGGHQPINSKDERFSLVANGEIYNYIELFETYRQQKFPFTTDSDSETIIPVWQEAGLEGIGKLNGMFAFALHDRKKNQLILARDRVGIKPLFYAPLVDRIVFASELKAIIPLLGKQPEINPIAVNQFMHNQFNTGQETVFKGVYRVQPGECLLINSDLSIKKDRYWSAAEVKSRAIDYEEAAQEFDAIMASVMKEHIRSDVPFGLFLSGGVDSAVILAMLKKFDFGHVKSYSIGYHSQEMRGELSAAQKMADRFGTQHQSIRLHTEELKSRIPLMIWATDDLMRDYAALPTSILSQTAANDLKVIFTGEGGDEAFAGYGRYRKTSLQRNMLSLFKPGSGGFRTRSQLHQRYYSDFANAELLAHQHSYRDPFVNAWQATPSNWSDIQRSQYTDMVTALPDNLLVKVDRNTMAFGLEARVPFLDHRIIEFGLSLPDELKTARGQGKLFLKRWAEQFIPADHLYRKKLGFHVPAGEILDDLISSGLEVRLLQNEATKEWFNEDGIKGLFTAHKKGKTVTREIWSIMHFAIWQRMYITHPGIKPSDDENPLDWI